MAHLTHEDRVKLELMIKSRYSLNKIAKELDKSPSTITREVKKHYVLSDKVNYHRIPNRCIHRTNCDKSYLCSKHIPVCRKKSCRLCEYCNDVCTEFVEEKCSKLNSSPFVCNGCADENKCTLFKRFYISDIAHKKYSETLSESRKGVNLTEREFTYLDDLFSPLLLSGQSIHHIWVNNKNEMICSKKSIYRYVNGSLFSARNIDLPRVVRMKPRKTKPLECKIDRSCYLGRTYEEFKKYLSENPGIQVVEMDTVEGVKGGKVLLTLHFKGAIDFMLAFIRDHNTSQSVIDIFNLLYERMGPVLFKKMFGCLLTDRGSEFTNPIEIETAPDGTRRSKVFYCNPQAAWQKPNVELNHEFIRRILPKGYNFNHLVQDDIDLMMNNINSYGREKLNDQSPAAVLSSLFGKEVLGVFNTRIIPANEIILTPRLLKKQ